MKMRTKPRASWLYAVVLGAFSLAAQAQDATLGANVESLLDFARSRNPEYASMRYEADAAADESIEPFAATPGVVDQAAARNRLADRLEPLFTQPRMLRQLYPYLFL